MTKRYAVKAQIWEHGASGVERRFVLRLGDGAPSIENVEGSADDKMMLAVATVLDMARGR